MAKVIKINFKELSKLDKARSFNRLPERIKDFFYRESTNLSQSSMVIKAVGQSRWYIIEKGSFLKMYYLEAVEVYDNGVKIMIAKETPTYSDNIFHYPIYRVGIAFNKNENLYISGHERERLKDERQIQKWDYFFRASPEEAGYHHLQLMNDLEEWKDQYQSLIVNNGWIVGLIVIGGIVVLSKLWLIVALPLVIFVTYKFRKKFVALFRTIQTFQALNSSVQKLAEEKAYIESQVYQTTVSGRQMEDWLREEVQALDKKAIQELGLPADKVIRRELGDNLGDVNPQNSIVGLKIQEWGITQPISSAGKKSLVKKHKFHLRALRYNQGRPLVGVYYIYFIYMTPETIGISGFFYDFILAKRFGTVTTQYYYRDIVGIGTAVKETKVLEDQEELETKQVILSFVNNEKITIALTDKVAIENLREQIERKQAIETDFSNQELALESPINPDLDQLDELSEEGLPATSSNFVLTNIKTYWNQKKNFNLPPSSESKYLS